MVAPIPLIYERCACLADPFGAILFFHPFTVDCPLSIPIRDHPSAHLQATTT